MDKHVTEWLGVYLDGELESGHVQQVRRHLGVCPACRQEFTQMKALSLLLRSERVPMAISTASFVARLHAQLPDRPAETVPNRNHQVVWWLTPMVVLVLGFVYRMISDLAGLLLFAGQAGYLGNAIRSLSNSEWLSLGSPSLIAILGSWVNDALNAILPGMGSFWQVAGGIMGELAWLAALLFICAAWLVAGWNKRSLHNKQELSRN